MGESTSTGALYLGLVILLCAIATPATWARTDARLPIVDHTYGEILDIAVISVTGQNSEQSPSQLRVSALLTFLPRSVRPGQVHATQDHGTGLVGSPDYLVVGQNRRRVDSWTFVGLTNTPSEASNPQFTGPTPSAFPIL